MMGGVRHLRLKSLGLLVKNTCSTETGEKQRSQLWREMHFVLYRY
jgi:hypothetical protein